MVNLVNLGEPHKNEVPQNKIKGLVNLVNLKQVLRIHAREGQPFPSLLCAHTVNLKKVHHVHQVSDYKIGNLKFHRFTRFTSRSVTI